MVIKPFGILKSDLIAELIAMLVLQSVYEIKQAESGPVSSIFGSTVAVRVLVKGLWVHLRGPIILITMTMFFYKLSACMFSLF